MNNNFRNIKNLNISILGLGYLGYSNIINFSSSGLKININDFGNKINRANIVKNYIYPTSKIKIEFNHFYKNKINFDNVIKSSNNNIFKNVNSFIYLCNSKFLNSNDINDKFIKLIKINLKNIKKNKPTFVIEFLNAPGKIYNDFIWKLLKINLKIGKDYNIIFAPRNDWSIDTIYENRVRPAWSNKKKYLEIFKNICGLLNQEVYQINKLDNLELISNLKNSLEHINNVFINQLSLSYPKINFQNLIEDFNNLYNAKISLSGIGSMGLRLPSSSLNLIKDNKHSEQLTILKEVIHTDFSMFKNISAKIKFNKKMKVGILGLGYHDNKSYEGISPSLELYQDLKNQVKEIALNDSKVNFHDYSELKNINQFNFPNDLKNFEVIILTKNDELYNSLSWKKIKTLFKTKLIIDTCGAWNKFPWKETNIKYKLIT